MSTNDTTTTQAAIEGALRGYGFDGSIHAAIDTLCKAARQLSPVVAESALDTGNTDTRPTSPRSAVAWDLVAIAHALNLLSN